LGISQIGGFAAVYRLKNRFDRFSVPTYDAVMTAKEPLDKQPSATPSVTPAVASPVTPATASSIRTVTPKAESEYDKMIREKQEFQMDDCCGGYQSRYDYKPRSVSKPADTPPLKK